MIRSIRSVIGFLTVLPVGMSGSYEEVAKNAYLFPLVGALIGVLAGASTLLLRPYLPTTILSIIGFFTLLFLTGLHHLDGLLDMGDALMYRGPVEKRITILHDVNTGTGGFTIGLLSIFLGVSITIEYLLRGGNPITLFVLSEAVAKTSILYTAFLGKPAFKGMGSLFLEVVHKSPMYVIISTVITLLIAYPLMGPSSLALLVIPLASAIFHTYLGRRLIGGVSGDILGAVNEVTRIFVMGALLWML